jgi:hypothetical protein
MAWDKYVIYKYGLENVRQRHLMNVYADPEFIAEVELLIGEDGSKLLSASFKETTAKYCITDDELMHYVAGLTAVLPTPADKPFFVNMDEYDSDKGYFSVTFDVDTIKDKDFQEIWNMITRKQQQRSSGKQRRNRKYDDDKLVYAIFKELQNNPKLKFPAIFELYQTGLLRYYKDGTTNWLSSAKDLREYYNSYKPSTKPPSRSAAAKRFYILSDQAIRKYAKAHRPKPDKT